MTGKSTANGASGGATAPAAHIVVVSSPGMGHVIPLAEFARQLAGDRRFSVTFVAQTAGPATAAHDATLTSLLDAGVSVVAFPPPPSGVLSVDGDDLQTAIFDTNDYNLPHLRRSLEMLKEDEHHHLAGMFVDLFSSGAMGIAREMEIPCYVLFTANCASVAFGSCVRDAHQVFDGEFRDLPEPLRIPGSSAALLGTEFPEPVRDRRSPAYAAFLHGVQSVLCSDGILSNTFEALEKGIIAALRKDDSIPPIYPIGPLVRRRSSGGGERRPECLRWLDGQPPGTVLYVSFGSGGTLTERQTEELAMGLEMSRQRFLWVARPPHRRSSSGAFFVSGDGAEEAEEDFLPRGFVERTSERGMVVKGWAPQPEVLGHESVGGFISHCGWNSVMESVVSGVPMIAWPLYADQMLNAAVMDKDARVALRVSPEVADIAGDDEEGGSGLVVGREEVCRVVRILMEGEEGKEVRRRMRELGEEAARAREAGGSSSLAMSELTMKLLGGRTRS